MSSDNVQKHNPIDNSRAKSEKRKKIIIFLTVIVIVLAASAFFYARTAAKGSEQISSTPNVKSKVSHTPASSSAASQTDVTLEDSSPAKLAITSHEENQKNSALKAGRTHIDSTSSLKDKAQKSNAEKKPPQAKKVVEKQKEEEKATTKKKEDQAKAKQSTPEEIRRQNVAKLLSLPSHFPVAATNKKIAEYELKLEKNYSELAPIKNEYTVSGDISNWIQRDTIESTNTTSKASLERTDSTVEGDTQPLNKKPKQIKVAGSGDMVMCELRWEVNSDYNLPVFCDVVEPPLRPAIIVGAFEMTARQDGVLLRGNRIEFDDESVPINAYGVDIKTDTSPLFDNNYDSHFLERTLARTSAAFMVPFVDFVVDTTTTIADGSVVISTPAITKTKDKIIGGVANVAKEFLPDLRRNANLPPTITIPNRYVVGMVMVSPVYSSSKDLAERSKSEPARTTLTYAK
ncbi:hypothetical protein [Vibrio sp. TRT 29B02]|uniref:hypothetical protein n=1 Tax=Vibrio sp. TRT 29B02 TaxID=3418508 RepID=UPI003CEBCB82